MNGGHVENGSGTHETAVAILCTRAAEGMQDGTGEGSARRRQLRKEALAVLKAAVSDGAAEQAEKIWALIRTLFEGFASEITQTPVQELYGLIRAIKDTLSLSSNHPISLEPLLETMALVLDTMGMERCAEMFGMGVGFCDALEVVVQCMKGGSPSGRTALGCAVLDALRCLVSHKKNATGCMDMMRRCLLIPLMQSQAPWHEMEVLNGFVAEVLFHPSMERQYKTYLAANDEGVLMGKEALGALEKAPTVHALFQTIEGGIGERASAARVLPFLVSEFVDRLAVGKFSEGKACLLPAKKASFLFAAKLCGAVLNQQSMDEESFLALLGILKVVALNALYEPTVDEGFLQLQFLQRVVRRTLVGQDKGHPLGTRPAKKRRKLQQSSTALTMGHLLDFCATMLSIEHRTLMPFLQEVLKVICATQLGPAAMNLLLKLMEICGNARKWTVFFLAMIKALALDMNLLKAVTKEASLGIIQNAVQKLPVLETPNFLEAVVQEWKSMTRTSLWASNVDLLVLMETVVSLLHVHESTAVAISRCLSQLMPSLETLQKTECDSELFLQILKFCLAVNHAIEKCKELHPESESGCLLSSMKIESLIEVASTPSGSATEIIVRCLLLRLTFLHQQHLKEQFRTAPTQLLKEVEDSGLSVAELLIAFEASMSKAEGRQLRNDLLMTYSVPWVTFCTPEMLTASIKRALDDFSHSAQILQRLFLDPAVLSHQNFIQCFHSAFFQSLSQLSECLQQQCPLLTELLIDKDSVIDKLDAIRQLLVGRLKRHPLQQAPLKTPHVSAILDLMEFGLKLPPTCFQDTRIQLEAVVVLLSTFSSDAKTLNCMAFFSLESIQDHPSKAVAYLSAAFFWVLHFSKQHFDRTALEDDALVRIEAALCAMLKQVMFSQWCHGNCDFFSTTPRQRLTKPWKQKRIHATTVLAAFSIEPARGVSKDACFHLACIGVFVRLCKWLIGLQHQQHLSCLHSDDGYSPAWSVQVHRLLKRQNCIPDFDQNPSLLQTAVLPSLTDSLDSETIQTSDPWRELHLGLVAGILSDLIALSFKHPSIDASGLVPVVLQQIHSLGQGSRWRSVPLRLERIADFLHNTSVCMRSIPDGLDQLHGMTQLHLRLFVKVLEASNDEPDPLQQPFLLAVFDPRIVFADPAREVPCRNALLDSFTAFVSLLNDKSFIQIAEALLHTLQHSHSLEPKFAALQFLLLVLHIHRSQIQEHHAKVPGKYLQATYSCFWEGYVRHVLLTLVDRRRRKSVAMPDDNQSGVFCALLCSFLRCFSLCHCLSSSIPQRTTIQIVRRIKRLIEAFYRRTAYGNLPAGSAWFGEMCEFLISAVRAQKSAAAAKELFPSFRAALESLLSLLMVWELECSSQTPVLARAEAKLGAIYSTVTSCPVFAEGLPDLLFSFLYTTDNLRRKQFTKKSPLATYFKNNPAETISTNSNFLERVQRHVLTVHAAMNHSQIKELKSQLMGNDHLMTQLESLELLNGRFSGGVG